MSIANTLGGCFKAFEGSNRLVWMPAHTTIASVGEVKMSNGSRLTTVDWRANRLVDALAKLSALEAQYLPAAIKLLKSAEKAVLYAAKLLGRVTYAANHHSITVTDDLGNSKTKICRDVMDAPKRKKRRLSPPPGKPKAAPSSTRTVTVKCCTDVEIIKPLKAPRVGAAPLTHAQAARHQDQEHLKRRVEEIGSSLVTPPQRPSANDRLTALRRRVGILPALSAE